MLSIQHHLISHSWTNQSTCDSATMSVLMWHQFRHDAIAGSN